MGDGVECFAQALTYSQLIEKGRAAEARYNYADSLKWYELAWGMDQSDIEVLVSISKQLTGLERLDEAKETFERILEINPYHSEAHTLLAIYYEKFADDFALAKEHYRFAIVSDPKFFRPRKLLCQLLLQLQEFEETKKQSAELMEKFPQNHEGYSFSGNIAFKAGDISTAIEYLKKAISLTQDDPEPYRLMGQALAKNGNREEAQQMFETYKQIKDSKERISGLITSVRREPGEANNWFRLGKEYLRRKQMGAALDSFHKGLEVDPESPTIHSLLGTIYLQARKVPQAQSHLEIAISLDPDSADNYNNLGVCYLMQSEFESAIASFKSAINLGKNEEGVYRNLQIAKQKLLQEK